VKSADWLWEQRSDVYSQEGEDGIISAILDCLPKDDTWCVEFGAADGKYLSNSRNLIEHRGFSAVLIEADNGKFTRLREMYASQPQVHTKKATVGFNSDDGLDQVLAATPVPRDFSFLSIDIDGNDYHVWKAIQEYVPRIVCIEFNPTIPTEVDFVQPADPEVIQGSSLTALVELGRAKGYELAAVLRINAFFVRRDLFGLLGISDNDPRRLRKDLSDVTWFFVGYDGTVFLRGGRMLPWHRLPLFEKRFQALPRWLRRYPTKFGLLRKAAYGGYLLWSDPRTLFRKLRNRFSTGRRS
jgi:hypothetical protein